MSLVAMVSVVFCVSGKSMRCGAAKISVLVKKCSGYTIFIPTL